MAYNGPFPEPIQAGGTNASSFANTNGTTYYTGSAISSVNPGVAGDVLTSNGAGSPPSFQTSGGGGGHGVLVNQVFASNNSPITAVNPSFFTGPTSPPQQSEGTQLVTATITPTSATNTLWIQFNTTGFIEPGIVGNVSLLVALFQDSNPNALCTQVLGKGGGAGNTGSVGGVINFYLQANTTSATTFKVRYGPELTNSGISYLNQAQNGSWGSTFYSTLSVSEVGAGPVPTSLVFDADSGSATESGGVVELLGAGSIATVASGNTVTTQLTGITNHSLVVGTGGPTLTNLGVATNGQLPIGSTGADPVLATLTAGTGVSITNGAGSITISATGGGTSWTNVTGTTQTIAANNSYLSNNAGTVTFTLPASGTIGDNFTIAGVQGSWTLAQNANQQILIGNSATTVGVGGSLSSTNSGDCIECVATNTSASTVWRVISLVGNITRV